MQLQVILQKTGEIIYLKAKKQETTYHVIVNMFFLLIFEVELGITSRARVLSHFIIEKHHS